MIFFPTVFDLFFSLIIFSMGLLCAIRISKFFVIKSKRAAILYFWHTIFCIFYAYYVVINGGDAVGYYESSLASEIDISVGTAFIVLLTRLFSYYLDFSFLSVSLIFNIFGTIGLIAFDGAMRYASFDKKKSIRILASLVIFLPSVSFWSSAIGKDSLSFMSVGIALWAASDFFRRSKLMYFSILLMFLIRPHIAALMIFGIFSSIIFNSKNSAKKKLVTSLLLLLFAAGFLPFVLNYAGLGDVGNIGGVEDYISERQESNLDGGSSVDLSSMNPLMQLFTYLFRPMLFEASSVLSVAAALDNLVLLFIFLLGLKGIWKSWGKQDHAIIGNRIFMWSYSIFAWIILAVTTANLGISIRQKWMFVPMLMFLLISAISTRSSEIKQRN